MESYFHGNVETHSHKHLQQSFSFLVFFSIHFLSLEAGDGGVVVVVVVVVAILLQ